MNTKFLTATVGRVIHIGTFRATGEKVAIVRDNRDDGRAEMFRSLEFEGPVKLVVEQDARKHLAHTGTFAWIETDKPLIAEIFEPREGKFDLAEGGCGAAPNRKTSEGGCGADSVTGPAEFSAKPPKHDPCYGGSASLESDDRESKMTEDTCGAGCGADHRSLVDELDQDEGFNEPTADYTVPTNTDENPY